MQNNMELGYEMFCYQCEQTANGKGCTRQGVCGKTPEIANLQDLLIFQLKGISCYGKILLDQGEKLDKGVISFIENCLFTTLTNVNFDSEVHVKLLKEAQKIKDELRQQIGGVATENIYMSYRLPQEKSEMLRTAEVAGIMYDQDLDEDIRGKDVLIVEDIIDSGNTLSKVREILSLREPKSLAICTLLDKPSRREVNVPVEFIGFSIPDEFVVGYGIDYAQRYRHLPYIGKVILLDE